MGNSDRKRQVVKDLKAGDFLLDDLSQDCSNQENHVVGLGSDLERIKNWLTDDYQVKLKAISIVGMGGIGKTTLARRVFDDPSIKNYFHICLWVTVSQEYHARKMVVSLLRGLDIACGDTEPAHDLGEILYKKLIRRRYLIVMDDVWSTQALDEVKIYFPNTEDGSRILLTTRLSQVSIYLNSEGSHHMNFLNEDDGWQLLCQKLFGKLKCPPKLQDIGRSIVTNCHGLPLAITLVAGYLRNISRTPECWTEVAETGALDQCLDIIGLSYNHLPNHLKACFLYMGAFPADSEIPSQKLIRLWIAEGFLNQVETKSLENVAEEWLEDLTQRHLILIRKGSHGRIKTCHMHDLLRYFCLRETKKENFLYHYPEALHEGMNYPCRVIFHSYDSSFNLSVPQVHSLLCFQNVCADFFDRHRGFKLLMILDFYVSRFSCFPSEIVQLVNLRYLALSIDEGLPSTISNLQNLQIFILRCYLGGTTLPWQIWNLPQLRHLHCIDSCFLPDPFHAENDGKILLALSNLLTLSKLSLSCCTRPVFAALPNLKKLGICETEEACRVERSWSDYDGNSDNYSSISTTENVQPDLDNVAQLHQLETLKLIFLGSFTREPRRIPSLDAFRPSLKKLTLSFSYLPWEYMNVLCMLHNLEVLKLKSYAFTGQEWEQHEEGFDQLKFLLLECTDLVSWKADKDYFPRLEHLVLKFCKHLQTIPIDIGEIATLKIIEVHGCTHFAVMSVKEIQEEQLHMGNDALEVHISMAEQDIFADLQLEEDVYTSAVPCISEYLGPDSSDLQLEDVCSSAVPCISEYLGPDSSDLQLEEDVYTSAVPCISEYLGPDSSDLQLEEDVYSSAVPCISEYLGPDSSDLQLEDVYSPVVSCVSEYLGPEYKSAVPCISESLGPDSSGQHIPCRHSLQVKIKELMFLVLLVIVFWLISWYGISSSIKKLTLQGLIVLISWQTDLLTALRDMWKVKIASATPYATE